MTKGTGREVKESEFKQMKNLIGLGLNFKQVAEIAKRSTTVVSYVNRSETFPEYKKFTAERYIRKDKPEKKETVDTPATVQPNVTTNEGRIINALVEIAGAVNRLADVLEQDTPIEKQAKEYKLFGRK